MRRIIQSIDYLHEDHLSEITMEVVMEGASATHLRIESTTVGGDTTVTITDAGGIDGIPALAANEGITVTEALGAVSGVLADLEKADRLNRQARSGLTEHVLHRMAHEEG